MPDQHLRLSTGQSLEGMGSCELPQRLWSEGSTTSGSHSQSATSRRTDSLHRLGTCSSEMTLSELALKPLQISKSAFLSAFGSFLGSCRVYVSHICICVYVLECCFCSPIACTKIFQGLKP